MTSLKRLLNFDDEIDESDQLLEPQLLNEIDSQELFPPRYSGLMNILLTIYFLMSQKSTNNADTEAVHRHDPYA